jgi:hypothetical protein
MPITRKHRDQESDGNGSEEANAEPAYTSFVYKPRWFVISQTAGDEIASPRLPQWEADRALAALDIEQIWFTATDGNCQGYARNRQVAINPVAQLHHKTLFHEVAHVVLGHTTESTFSEGELTPRNLREVEAEAVALLCCETLNLEGADFCRGYIQNWLCPAVGYDGDAIPEKSAQKIFRAADQILRGGRVDPEQDDEQSQ